MTWKPISDNVNNNTLVCADTDKLFAKNSINIVNSHEPLDLYLKRKFYLLFLLKLLPKN